MKHLYLKETDPRNHTVTAYNFSGTPLYYIQGKWGRLDDIVTIHDSHGDLIYQAKQTLLSFFPRFELTVDGEHLADITKRRNFFSPNEPYYTISEYDWKISAKENAFDFYITHKGVSIGLIQKHQNYHKKAYTIGLSSSHDMALAALMAVIVDHFSEKPEEEPATLRFISINGKHFVQLPRSDYFDVSHQLSKTK